MLKTYQGSCHCGAIRIEAEIDLEAGTRKCNCSICTKRRMWGVILKPKAFRLLSEAGSLGDYAFGSKQAHHRFCSQCGCAPFGTGHVEQIGGDYVSVNLGCLDDASDEELTAAPVTYSNGREDCWWERPVHIRHL